MTAIGKITAKGQTTIPQDIRAALGVGPGDLLAWEVIADGSARVRRVQPLDAEWRQLRYLLFDLPGAAGPFANGAQIPARQIGMGIRGIHGQENDGLRFQGPGPGLFRLPAGFSLSKGVKRVWTVLKKRSIFPLLWGS